MEFPRMVYRAGGAHVLEAGSFDIQLVQDEDHLLAAQLDGWRLDQYAARDAEASAAAEEAAKVQAQAEREAAAKLADDSAPPTRDELEQMATKLGLPFSPRTSDKKLRLMVDAAASSADGSADAADPASSADAA
jgi:hypothetical protein